MTAIVLTPTFDGRDGLSCLSRDITRALGEACPGADIRVLSLAGPPDMPAGAARASGCSGSRARLVARTLAMAARRPDLLLVLHVHLLPLAWPALARGSALVHVLVGVEAWRPLPAWHARVLAQARAVAAISAHTRDRFVAANPWWGTRPVHVVYPSAPRAVAPAGDHPAGERGYALMVGRMAADERYKGHDVVLDAWPRVLAKVPGARLVIAGDGDDAARLRARVRADALGSAVHFTGRVDDRTLAALYRDAALFVLPSPDEGFGYVYLEAMAAGLPCVAAHGAAEEIVVPDETGLIVSARDAEGIAAALVRLLTHPDDACVMGEAGRARVATHFGPARLADRLRRVLATVAPC